MLEPVRKPSLRCPSCHGILDVEDQFARCRKCSREYLAVLGIPDLRLSDPPYSSRAEDLGRARVLADHYDDYSGGDLLQYCYQNLHPELDPERRNKLISARLDRPQVNLRRWELVQRLISDVDLDLTAGTALDMGCGTGGLITTLASQYSWVVGADIVMEELVLAKKLLEEAGLSNFQLICCEAESFPFEPESFSLINATDVIEHVRDQKIAVCSLFRGLADGGLLCFNSPNRFDAIHPEPHVGVRWVGFVPRALQPLYVRWANGMGYHGKRLLSLSELRSLANEVVLRGGNCTILYWPRWNSSASPRTPLGQLLLARPALVARMNSIWGHFVSNYEVLVTRSLSLASGSLAIRPIQPTASQIAFN